MPVGLGLQITAVHSGLAPQCSRVSKAHPCGPASRPQSVSPYPPNISCPFLPT
jgi:hypothetical protein